MAVMSKITASDIQHLAALSKLSLSDDEVEKYQREIEAILTFVDQLQAVDVSDFEPTEQVSGLKNVLRADRPQDVGATPTDLLSSAPTKDEQYVVKRVLEQ